MPLTRRQFVLGAGCVAASVRSARAAGAQSSTQSTVVLYDYSSESQNAIFGGLQEALVAHRVQRLDLPQSSYLSSAISGDPQALIVTIGDAAAEALHNDNPTLTSDVSICHTALSAPIPEEQHSPIATTLLVPNFDEYLQRLTATLPQIGSLGVLTSDENSDAMTALRDAAERHDLSLVSYPVYKREEITDGLNYVARRADVLFAFSDPSIYNNFTARHILVFCLRQRLPVVGPTSGWVRHGAVFSFAVDYDALGRSYGTLCESIVSGERQPVLEPLPIPAAAQRYLINPKSAAVYRLRIEPATAGDLVTYAAN
ncbi:MAG: ABC transporter substrate binding protein [Pseudomonadota bacterium]